MVGLVAYYLASPFNLLFLFCSEGGTPLMFTLVLLLKLGCCGISFYTASRAFFGDRRLLLAFSTAYALMGYNAVFGWNLMWLDGVILLPLMVLGLWRIWTERRYGLYTGSLFLILLSSYYIGYMLCIASVLFFLAMMLWTGQTLHSPRERLCITAHYLLASLAGGLLASVLWLPAILSLRSSRLQTLGRGLDAKLSFPIWDLPGKFMPGAVNTHELLNGLPNVFCGTAVLFLVLLFFMNRDVSVRKRLVAGGCLLFLLLSFSFSALNTIWHGFSSNNGYNYRYSFLFSYLLLMLAQTQMLRFGLSDRRSQRIALGLLVFGLCVAAVRGYEKYLTLENLLYGALALLLLGAVLLLSRRKTAPVSLALAAILLLDLGINYTLSLNRLVWLGIPLDLGTYYDFIDHTKPAVHRVQTMDGGLYRMEKTFYFCINDPLLLGYRGLSHFSSSFNRAVPRFLGQMGLRDTGFWANYNRGTTAEAESLLGLRYLLSGDDLTVVKGYEDLGEETGTRIYRNRNALPLALLADPSLLTLDMTQKDLFALHNAIWPCLDASGLPILTPADPPRVSTHNLTVQVSADGITRYRKIDQSLPASLCYEIDITETDPLYYYFSAPSLQEAELFLNDTDMGAYFDEYQWDIACAGRHIPGETVLLEIRPKDEELEIEHGLFYYEHLDRLADAAARIQRSSPVICQDSGTRFSGSYSAGEDTLLLFTIPYEEGWELRVDGEKTELIPAMDALLAAQVPAGEHRYSLRFVPPGLYPGMALSAAGAVLLLTSYVVQKRKRAQKEKKMSAHPADS